MYFDAKADSENLSESDILEYTISISEGKCRSSANFTEAVYQLDEQKSKLHFPATFSSSGR